MNRSPDQVKQIAYMCAGAGAAAVMQAAPDVEMPTGSLTHAVDALLREAGVGNDEPQCILCGCTEEMPCEGGCAWVANQLHVDVCSSCCVQLGKAAGMARVAWGD